MIVYTLDMMSENVTFLLDNPEKKIRLIMSKIAGKSQWRDFLQNTRPVLLKIVKIIKSKESLENSSQEEPKQMQS